MFCSICMKSASKLAPECCETTGGHQLASNAKRVLPEEDAIRKIECDICLVEYQEDELQQHREICMAQLVFRCAVCDGNYISKEGLWNHLDLHEIAEESKEMYYQEMRATYKLHKCDLCNDQRGYQESLYWKHVHEDHDGFFLKCLECGAIFESEKHKNEHALKHCKTWKRSSPTNLSSLETDQQLCNTGLSVLVGTTASVSCMEKHKVKNTDAHLEVSESKHSKATVEDSKSSDKTVHTRLYEYAIGSINVAEGMDNNKTERKLKVLPMHMLHSNNETNEEEIMQPFSVDICSRGSSTEQCSHCDKGFHNKSFLNCHIDNCHQPKECDLCGETILGRTRFRYHKLKNHSEPQHKCPYCPMKFHRNNNYQRHMSRHVEEKNFTCELCGAKFKSLQHVAMHKKRTHHVKNIQMDLTNNKEKNLVDESSLHSDHMIADKDNKKLISINHCSICERKFDDEHLLSHHVDLIHQLTICTICGETFATVDQLKDHKEDRHSQRHQTLGTTPSFKKHLDFHEMKATFQCGICDDRFEQQTALQSHMVNDHNTAIKPDGIQCTCPICGETIPSIIMFRQHKLKYHTEPAFQCPHCPKKFFTKGNYMSHFVAHKRKRIFSCRFCTVAYKRLHLLQAHIKRRHGDESMEADPSGQVFLIHNQNVEPEDLNHENSAYVNENESLEHGGIEIKEEIYVEEASIAPENSNSTVCVQCNQFFSDQNELHNHVNVHHQLKKCTTCGLKFDNLVRLRHHKLVSHTKPQYKCSHCTKMFHVKSAFLRHETTHSKIKEIEPLKPIIRIKMRKKSTSKETTNDTDQSTGVECNLCSRKFLNEERLQRHIDYTHSSSEVQCNFCDLKFTSQYKMYYHKIKAHTEPRHKCPHCEKKFHVKYRLQEHLAVHLT